MTGVFKGRSVSYILRKGSDTLLPVFRTTSMALRQSGSLEINSGKSCRHDQKASPNLENFKRDIISWRSK